MYYSVKQILLTNKKSQPIFLRLLRSLHEKRQSMMSFSVQTCIFFKLWTIKHVRLWWRSFHKFNSRGCYASDFFPNCSFTISPDISFISALYCLPLLNFKNSVFSSLSQSLFCLDILYFFSSDRLPLLFWHIRQTVPPETVELLCSCSNNLPLWQWIILALQCLIRCVIH